MDKFKPMTHLIIIGGDVSITNKDGDTPLYLSTFTSAGSACRDFSLNQMLISAGKTATKKNADLRGNTLLVRATPT